MRSDGITQRLRVWHEFRKRPSYPPDPEVLAGRSAELDFLNLVEGKFSTSQAKWFVGRRVPRSDGQGRLEIDQIILTHKMIYLVEVKNWGGGLDIKGGDYQTGEWIQRRRQKSDLYQPP